MSGICFFKTKDLKTLKDFYTKRLNMKVWVDQGSCVILRSESFLIGFCESDKVENNGIVTRFFKTRDEVDEVFSKLEDISTCKPRENEKYKIYQFFGKDPDGRTLEFQAFLHDLDWSF